MKKWIWAFLLSALMVMTVGCGQKNFDAKLAKEARVQTLQMCPKTVAEGLVFDSMSYDAPTRTLLYYYTMDDSVYSDDRIRNGMEIVRVKLLEAIVSSVELKNYKEHGIDFKYIYTSKADPHKIKLSFLFKPKDYGTK